MNTFLSLQEKINKAKDLDFGTIINDTIELFKKVWVKGFLMILFIVIIAFCLTFVFSAMGISSQNFQFTEGFSFDLFFDFYVKNALYSIPQTILVSTITLAFIAAFYRICRDITVEGKATDDYFYFFKKEYFSKVFMLGIIYTAIATAAQLLFLVPYIYALVPLSYFAVVLANNPHLSETEIIKISFALGNKKWLITFGTMFVAGILGMLGIIGCGIGILLTLSIVYLPVFLIYRDVVGFEDTSEIDKIGMTDDQEF